MDESSCHRPNIKLTFTDEAKHYHEIIELLKDEEACCYKIGTWLKFTPNQLDAIKAGSADHADAMGKIVCSWLRGNYDTEMFGPPTWKMLVEAVRAPTGGNNTALAKKIAKAHSHIPETSCVSCTMYTWDEEVIIILSV